MMLGHRDAWSPGCLITGLALLARLFVHLHQQCEQMMRQPFGHLQACPELLPNPHLNFAIRRPFPRSPWPFRTVRSRAVNGHCRALDLSPTRRTNRHRGEVVPGILLPDRTAAVGEQPQVFARQRSTKPPQVCLELQPTAPRESNPCFSLERAAYPRTNRVIEPFASFELV